MASNKKIPPRWTQKFFEVKKIEAEPREYGAAPWKPFENKEVLPVKHGQKDHK